MFHVLGTFFSCARF